MTSNRNPISKYFITFPKSNVSRECFLKFLQERPLRYHLVAEEKHADGTPHLHAVVWLDKPISKAKFLKIFKVGFPEDYHRIQLQAVRSMNHAVDYCKKEDLNPLESLGGHKLGITTTGFPVAIERLHRQSYMTNCPANEFNKLKFQFLHNWTFEYERQISAEYLFVSRISRNLRTPKQQMTYDNFPQLCSLIVHRRSFYHRWM